MSTASSKLIVTSQRRPVSGLRAALSRLDRGTRSKVSQEKDLLREFAALRRTHSGRRALPPPAASVAAGD